MKIMNSFKLNVEIESLSKQIKDEKTNTQDSIHLKINEPGGTLSLHLLITFILIHTALIRLNN